jgi:hypothetical protein
VAVALFCVSAAAVTFVFSQGLTLALGDAEAHLNIARRVLDNREPRYRELGTVWLPFPHVAMLPGAQWDWGWWSGLAGVGPSMAAFLAGGVLFYGALRDGLESRWAGVCGLAVVALNPNVLFLQATPMTEPFQFLSLSGVMYHLVRYRRHATGRRVVWLAACASVGVLTRYEAWALLPVLVALVWLAGGGQRWRHAALLAALLSLAPLYWLAHNYWIWGDALEFYRGPYSAQAIYQRQLAEGMTRYPADGSWTEAARYFGAALRWTSGRWILVAGLAGAAVAVWQGRGWLLAVAVVPPVFYLYSLHASGTPVFVPDLWPHSYYNIRYSLAALPLLAAGAAALIPLVPGRVRGVAAVLLVAVLTLPRLAHRHVDQVICVREALVNSASRRAWTAQAAEFLRGHYRRGDGIFFSFGDLTGAFRTARIPLRESLHEGNELEWLATRGRPELFLRERWVLCREGDAVHEALTAARARGLRYTLAWRLETAEKKAVEIYFRDETGSLLESARRAQ